MGRAVRRSPRVIARDRVDGAVAPTPIFLGANPAPCVTRRPHRVRPLGLEEDVARALLDALPEAARRRAMIDDTAPADIVTANAPRVDIDLAGGVAVADLTGRGGGVAANLCGLHLDRSASPRARCDRRPALRMGGRPEPAGRTTTGSTASASSSSTTTRKTMRTTPTRSGGTRPAISATTSSAVIAPRQH